MGCAFQLPYEDILKILSSVFFGDGKSREGCNKLLPKRLIVFVNPLSCHQDYYKGKTTPYNATSYIEILETISAWRKVSLL